VEEPGTFLLDVRDLVDKPGNRTSEIAAKIRAGASALRSGKKVLVGCDYGISRSNAIAAGVLSEAEGISVNAAVRKVQETTGEHEIKVSLVSAVRAALLGEEKKDRSGILVTGAGGFIGRALCEGGEAAVPCTRRDADLEKGATDLELMADEKGIGCIVHLANPQVYTSNLAMGQSLTLLKNVIDVCVHQQIRLVFLSGWEVFSGYRGNLYADASTPLLPKGPYGETKVLCETLIEHSRATRNLRCQILRPSPVYSSTSDRPRFIRTFLEKARAGLPITTHRYHNGDPGLDLLHLQDLVTAIRAAALRDGQETLHLGTGRTTTTHEIARRILEKTGSHSSLGTVAIDDTTASIAMDSQRAQALLGWKPLLSFWDGLDAILQESL
jgi:UDP-glucuronate decarboxylase